MSPSYATTSHSVLIASGIGTTPTPAMVRRPRTGAGSLMQRPALNRFHSFKPLFNSQEIPK